MWSPLLRLSGKRRKRLLVYNPLLLHSQTVQQKRR
jgi:hypothetical protein